MSDLNPNIATITLNVNTLSTASKRQIGRVDKNTQRNSLQIQRLRQVERKEIEKATSGKCFVCF